MSDSPINRLPADLAFYGTPPHPCSYLEQREAVNLFVDPKADMNTAIYSALAELGFRRSGAFVYRPRCPDCDACRPVRIPVREFVPNRYQRRTLRSNEDVHVNVLPGQVTEEHYQLYRRYVASRHPGGGMDVEDPGQYGNFLLSPWSDTRMVEFRADETLLAVAVVDYMDNGLSAVYTFFDPELTQRSLGTFAVLWQVEQARALGLPHVYLGYWVEQSPKMNYKTRFRPLEQFYGRDWRRLV